MTAAILQSKSMDWFLYDRDLWYDWFLDEPHVNAHYFYISLFLLSLFILSLSIRIQIRRLDQIRLRH